MKIRALKVENFRKFRQATELTGFSDGLNLVCEPNETGKSTVLEALRAALFERHGSKSDRIRSFRPYGDEVAPTIELDFEIDGQAWRVNKRFLQNPSVSLEGSAGRFHSDEAEEKLQSLLGFSRAGNRGADDDSRGALGLLWVEQGQSFTLGAPGQAARRTLEDVLAGEVGAVTGGRRTAAVVHAVDKSLGELLTATGKPTKRLFEAQEAAANAQTEANAAAAEWQQFEDTLTRLEGKRGELRRLVRDLEAPEQEEEVTGLRRELDRAKSAEQSRRNAELVLMNANADLKRLDQQRAERGELRDQLATAQAAAQAAHATQAEQATELATCRTAETQAGAEAREARKTLHTAELERDEATTLRVESLRGARLRAAYGRLERAELIARDLAAVEAQLAGPVLSAAALGDLDRLERAVLETRAAAEAGAATLTITPQTRAAVARLNGDRLDGAQVLPVTRRQSLEIDGFGVVTVEPPASGDIADARWRAAEQELAAALHRAGHTTVQDVRAAFRARREVEQARDSLRARLNAECPADPELGLAAGLDALRGWLSTQQRPSADLGDPEQMEARRRQAEERFQTTRADEAQARTRHEAALRALQAAQLEELRVTQAATTATNDVQRLEAELMQDLHARSDDDLVQAIERATTAQSAALLARDAAVRATEGLDAGQLERRLESAETRIKRFQADRLTLVAEVTRLEEQAKTLGGNGPATRAQAAAELAEAAQMKLTRLQEEAATLTLLKRTIEEAQLSAARRYLAPISNRVEPYVRRLLPAAALTFGEDYRPQLLMRGGREEAAESLSKGTQEQIAVLTRLAFADLLIAKGKPACLLLDDALVFADDARFELMTDILADAARRMQITILSCRAAAYRHVDANRLALA